MVCPHLRIWWNSCTGPCIEMVDRHQKAYGFVRYGTSKFHGWLDFPHLKGHNSGGIYMPKKGGATSTMPAKKVAVDVSGCAFLWTKTKSHKQLQYAPLPIPVGEKWSLSGWWYTYPSEKYEFVSWDCYSQYISEKNTKTLWPVPNGSKCSSEIPSHAMAHVSQQHQGLEDGTAVPSCDWDRISSNHILLPIPPTGSIPLGGP